MRLLTLILTVFLSFPALAAPVPLQQGMTWPEVRRNITLDNLSVAPDADGTGLVFDRDGQTWTLEGISSEQMKRILPGNDVVNLAKIPAKAYVAHVDTQASVLAPQENEILRLSNLERAKFGLAPLEMQPQLAQAARGHSEEMLRMGYFDHESPTPGRQQPWDRVELTGFRPRSVGENLYSMEGSPIPLTAAAAVRAWMDSPGHRANLLNPVYTRMGVSIVVSGRKVVVTQVFSSSH